jgi:hypothetical protein
MGKLKPSKAEILHPRAIVRRLQEEQSAATLNRLATSRHVADLRLIGSAAIYLLVLLILLAAIALGVGVQLNGVTTVIGGLFALGCGVIGWAYQSGNSRLGTVDLFACEITTICRVCTIVDLTRKYVEAFNADLPDGDDARSDRDEKIRQTRLAFRHFDVSEHYTPVFDNNVGDLRVLEVKVVTNVTAFYTYLKAMNDARRALTSVETPAGYGKNDDAWHIALSNVLYMQFLAFESARKAVRDLVEFEPNQIENVISILMSEVCAYRFLLNYFGTVYGEDDFRYARLQLRRDTYREVVQETYRHAKQEHDGAKIEYQRSLDLAFRDKDTAATAELRLIAERRRYDEIVINKDALDQWSKASETANELRNRYEKLFGKDGVQWYQG